MHVLTVLSPSEYAWLRGKARVCVRLIKQLILLQVCLHGSVLFHMGLQPLGSLGLPCAGPLLWVAWGMDSWFLTQM